MEAAFLLGLGAQHSRHAARESQGEPAAGGLEVPPVARALPWPSPPVAGPHAPPPPPWDLAQVCVLSEPLAQEEGRPRRGWPTPRLTTRTRRPARVSEPFHTESGLGELQSGPGAGLLLSPLESEGCPGDAALEGQSAPACVFQRTDNVKSSTKKESENPLPWSLLPHSTRPAT